ncbi:uncharacterized protein LOC120343927 isoform X2 [Styela clava]
MDSSEKAQVIRPASWDMGNEFMKDGPKSFVETDCVKDQYWQLPNPSDDVLYNSNAHSDFNESNETYAEDDFRDDKKLDVISTRAHDEKRECSEKTNALLSQRKEKHDDRSNCFAIFILPSFSKNSLLKELDDDTISCANARMAVTYWFNRRAVDSITAMLSSFALEISEWLGLPLSTSTMSVTAPLVSEYKGSHSIILPLEELYDVRLADMAVSKGKFEGITFLIGESFKATSSDSSTRNALKYGFHHPDVNNTLFMFKHKDNKQLDLANERILRKIGVSGPAGKVMLQLSSLVPYTLQPLVDGNDTNETKKQSGSKGQQSGSKQKQPQQTNGSFSYGTSASSTAGGGGGDDEDEDGRKRRRIQNHDSSDDDSDNDDSDEEEEERVETSNPGLNSRDEEKSASSSENPQIPDSADNTPSPIHLGLHANEINDGASTSRGTNAEIPIEEVNQISEHPSSIQVQRQANPDQPNGSLNTFGHKTRFIPDVRTVESDGPQPPPPPPVQSPPTNRVNGSNGTSVRRNELPDFEQQMLGTLPGVHGLFAELPWTSRNEDERMFQQFRQSLDVLC